MVITKIIWINPHQPLQGPNEERPVGMYQRYRNSSTKPEPKTSIEPSFLPVTFSEIIPNKGP